MAGDLVGIDNYFFHYFVNRQAKCFNLGTINFWGFSEWFKKIEDLENEQRLQRLADDINYRHPVIETVRKAIYSFLGEDYKNLTFRRNIDKMTINKSGKEIEIELLSDGKYSSYCQAIIYLLKQEKMYLQS